MFLHIGEPKTATTFLQHALRAGRDSLAAHGVRVAGHSQREVFAAVQDLRGDVRRDDDPAPSWAGAWDRLARQALRTPRVSVISHELLCAVDDDQAARAVASLRGAEVHVVLTVRDMASLLPAEWQETVKHRNTRGWDDWIGDVVDKEFGELSAFDDAADAAARREFWFWRVHDTARLLDMWHRHVPLSRVHVVTVPPRGSDRTVVWERFARLLDVPADVVDVAALDGNESLGLAEVELLRRLNCTLSADVPGWFYMSHVKGPLAHGVLAGRPSRGRLMLPADRLPWAHEYAEHLVADLERGGYDIVGDLADLRPAPPRGDALHPADVSDEELLDAAVDASAGLLRRRYARRSPATSHVSTVRDGLHRLSERNRLAGAARVGLRHGIERMRER